jgi:hypothetical protein
MTQNPADWSELREKMARLLCRQHYAERGYAPPGILKIVEGNWTAWLEHVDEVLALPDITRLRAGEGGEVERLRAALEPFAKAADIRLCAGDDYWTDDKSTQGTDIAFHIKFGDLRRARAALQSSPARVDGGCDEAEEMYQIGKRDGYEEAVQRIDLLTGGDGEYRFCTDGDPERHTPDAPAMVQRIVDRFAAASPAPGETVLGSSGEEKQGSSSARDHAPTTGAALEWRPIESAPRDGTRFEAQDRENYGDRVFEGTHWYTHPSVTGWNTDDLDCGDYEWEPTHWRPSSATPAEGDKSRDEQSLTSEPQEGGE